MLRAIVARIDESAMSASESEDKRCSAQQNGRLATPAPLPTMESPRGSGWCAPNLLAGGCPIR